MIKHNNLKIKNMKQFLIIILLVFAQQQINSQSLFLNELNGTTSEYGISAVRKIKFSSSEVQVILFSGDTIKRPFLDFKNYRYNQNTLSNNEHLTNLEVFNVYPNPTEDQLGFNFVSNSSAQYSYSVSDITGKVLLKKELGAVIGNYTGVISLAKYPSGIYFLTLKSGKDKVTKKIIKK